MTQMLKDITVFFDDTAAGKHVLEIAARLAAAQQAHLLGIATAVQAETSHGESFARGDAMAEVIDHRKAAIAAQLLNANRTLNVTAAALGINVDFRAVAPSESASTAALHAMYCDLLVVGHPTARGAPFTWSVTEVAQRAGVPLLIVPEAWHGKSVGQRITLAWNASRQSRRAVADALPLLVGAQEVQLLIVDAQQNTELHGEEPGADIAAYLARHGARVELQTIASASSVANAIVQQAVDNQADMIVFGAYSHPRLQEAVLGGVTRTLLAEVPLPLFVSH